jgi:hypothetical protein
LDCVNYLTGEGDLAKCFSLVHNYLDPDGIFLFDVNTPHKFKSVYGEQAYILEEDDGSIFCGWQNDFDEKTGLCRFLLSVFTEEKDGCYVRLDEEQTERCYTKDQLQELLNKTGFEILGCFGGWDFSEPADTCERYYFVARAKK